MKKRTCLLNLTLAISAGLVLVHGASASVGRPDVAAIAATTQPMRPDGASLKPQARSVSSFSSDDAPAGKSLASLRPVRRDAGIDFDEASRLLNTQTTNEQIFNKDFTGKMEGQYAGVKATEEAANNPLWRAHDWQVQRYEGAREGVAKWTAHEAMEDQLKNFFAGADKNSSAMKALSTARSLTGGEEEKPVVKKETPEEKAARAHRTDLPKQAEAEEVTPTKIKTKMNLLKQNGSVVFTNPVATTEINGNKDEVSMNMHRDFRKLQVSSNVNYAARAGVLNFNVNKRITERVSLDLNHYNYTGDQRDGAGYKSREEARVNYSMSF